jgi:Zn-dependent protease/CBS domain-containing protein
MNPSGHTAEDKAEKPIRGNRFCGVPVRLHFTFVLLLIFIVTYSARGGESAVFNAVYIIALFTSVLLHELGHVGVARRYGIRTLEIVLYPIGGVARVERSPKPKEELWIALAGPAVNILIATALFAYLGYSDPSVLANPTEDNLLARIAFGNLILAAFNMVPAFPMDGGRVLRALLARWQTEDTATKMAASAGRAFAILIGLYGLLSMQFMLIFIAFFVYVGASQETAAVVGRSLTEGIPVRNAMITDFRTLEHGSTVREAANMLLATSQQDFPVVLGRQVMGLLGRNALLRGMAVDGPDAYVAGIMDREFPRVGPEEALTEAIPLLSRISCILVMDNEQLMGLLTRENVSEFMMLRRFGMPAET